MDDINRYFEILGLKLGASLDEVKDAYKDLVKVWHPDRFAHDPKLQQKAQEKLKEINEAYEKLKAYYAEYSNQPPPKEEYQSDSSYQKNDSYQENMGNKDYENSASEPPKEPPYEEKNYKNAKQNNIKSKNGIPYKYLSWAFVAFGYLLANEFLASFSGVQVVIIYGIVGGLVGAIGYAVVKGINSLNVSKEKKVRIAWIVGIIGLFIVMVIFKVRTESPQSSIDDCILKYQKEAKCKQASAIINLACRGKYSDTATDCILKNIGDAQTDIAASSILRSCQNKYPVSLKDGMTYEEAIKAGGIPIEAQTPAPAPSPAWLELIEDDKMKIAYDVKNITFTNKNVFDAWTKKIWKTPLPYDNRLIKESIDLHRFDCTEKSVLGLQSKTVFTDGGTADSQARGKEYAAPSSPAMLIMNQVCEIIQPPAPPSTSPQTKYKSPTPNEKFNNSQTELASVSAPEPQLLVKRITERVVTDKETGLVWTWEANIAGKPMDREDADYFIEQLNEKSYAGYKDWRLPTTSELKTLSKNMQSYRLDFQNIQKNYWAATFASGSSDVVASVDMNDGYAWYKSKSEKTYVLPVRGAISKK